MNNIEGDHTINPKDGKQSIIEAEVLNPDINSKLTEYRMSSKDRKLQEEIKAHEQGTTLEAQENLARLALVRRQREEDKMRREFEKQKKLQEQSRLKEQADKKLQKFKQKGGKKNKKQNKQVETDDFVKDK